MKEKTHTPMTLAEKLRRKAVEGLPTIELEGETYSIRQIKEIEYAELIDDCMAFARSKTSTELKGKEPNQMKVAMMQQLLATQPEIEQLIGKINLNDSYSVAIAHAVTLSFGAMQCARSLTLADGRMAFSTLDDRLALVDVLINDQAVIASINGMMGQVGKNELPEASI